MKVYIIGGLPGTTLITQIRNLRLKESIIILFCAEYYWCKKMSTKHNKTTPGSEEAKGTAASRSERIKTFAKAAASTAAIGLVGAALVTSLSLTPKLARSQEKEKPSRKPTPVLIAQATPAPAAGKMYAQASTRRLQSGEASGRLPADLAALETITLDDLRGLIALKPSAGGTDGASQAYMYQVDFIKDGRPAKFVILESIDPSSKSAIGYLTLRTNPNNPSESIREDINGTDLSRLRELYKLATGRELKNVKVLVTAAPTGDPKLGFEIEVNIIPVRGPNADIEAGVPLVYVTYYSAWNAITVEAYQFIKN